MDKIQTAWIAGLLEGEGYFGFSKTRRFPYVSIEMTDRDVIQRASIVMDAGNVKIVDNSRRRRRLL